MSTSHEILTVAEFRGLRGQPEGVVVITDTASATKAHRTRCHWLKDSHFEMKVMEAGGRNGRYYFFLRFEDAARELNARWCGSCE